MSLFTNLINLHSPNKPIEDFFTEIIAYFFSVNKDILIKWLRKYFKIIEDSYDEINISTQKIYKSSFGLKYESRPDIVIEMLNGQNTDAIFVESKIGSVEGEGQLKKYANLLASLPKVRNRFLVYITRDFELKNKFEILDQKSSDLIQFLQLRWYQLYQFLENLKNVSLIPEITNFMKENNMSHNNQFSTIDLISMANFHKSLNLMEATLDGEVKHKFIEIFGTANKPSASLTQFRAKGRYIIFCYLMSYNFWCGIGFFNMNSNTYTEYPDVGIFLEVSPNFEIRPKIIETMKKIVEEKSDIWKPKNLFITNSWANISYFKNMKEFLSEEDHLSAIKKFFLQSLHEVEWIKDAYPYLPWRGSNDNE